MSGRSTQAGKRRKALKLNERIIFFEGHPDFLEIRNGLRCARAGVDSAPPLTYSSRSLLTLGFGSRPYEQDGFDFAGGRFVLCTGAGGAWAQSRATGHSACLAGGPAEDAGPAENHLAAA